MVADDGLIFFLRVCPFAPLVHLRQLSATCKQQLACFIMHTWNQGFDDSRCKGLKIMLNHPKESNLNMYNITCIPITAYYWLEISVTTSPCLYLGWRLPFCWRWKGTYNSCYSI